MNTEISKTQDPANENTSLAEARAERYIRPAYEVIPGGESYEVRVTMPGVDKAGLSVTLEKDDLLIEGRRAAWRQPSWQPVHREISDANYRLRLQLNVAINEEKITARIEDGILSVTLPVAEEAKPRTIAIE